MRLSILVALVFGFIFISCKMGNDKSCKNKELTQFSDSLIYCENCRTAIDVYNYEVLRGSQPIHHKIKLSEARRVFMRPAFWQQDFDRKLGRKAAWSDALIFVQVDSSKPYKVAHAYQIDSEEIIRGYTATIYQKWDIIDNLINDYSSAEKDYDKLKELYCHLKVKHDKQYGFSEEYSHQERGVRVNSILKELKSNFGWQYSDNRDITKFRQYYLEIDAHHSCFKASLSISEENECLKKVDEKDLSVRYINQNYHSRYIKDSIVNSWSITEVKRRMTPRRFQIYLEELQENEGGLEPTFERLSVYNRMKHMEEIQDVKLLESLNNIKPAMPDLYIESNIIDDL